MECRQGYSWLRSEQLAFGEDDEEIKELSEGDVSIIVGVNHLEHVGDEHRVRLETKSLGELGLGQLALDIDPTFTNVAN